MVDIRRGVLSIMSEHNRRSDDNPENRITKDYLKEILDLKLEPIVKLQAEHHRTLFGDGSEGYQGLRVEVDRIKQRNILINWIVGGISLPVLGSIGKFFYDMIHPKGG
jgi:hypothetical protein